VPAEDHGNRLGLDGRGLGQAGGAHALQDRAGQSKRREVQTNLRNEDRGGSGVTDVRRPRVEFIQTDRPKPTEYEVDAPSAMENAWGEQDFSRAGRNSTRTLQLTALAWLRGSRRKALIEGALGRRLNLRASGSRKAGTHARRRRVQGGRSQEGGGCLGLSEAE